MVLNECGKHYYFFGVSHVEIQSLVYLLKFSMDCFANPDGLARNDNHGSAANWI